MESGLIETKPVCNRLAYFWDGEYEGNCELSEDHEGDHFDGRTWFNDDNEITDYDHQEVGTDGG